MNVDTILLEIQKYGFDNLPKDIHGRDIKILKSLSTIIGSGKFITENQAKLLLKIMTENQQHLTQVNSHIPTFIATPIWSNPFRKVDQTRKVFVGKDHEGELVLAIEFAFNAGIRKIVNSLDKELIGGLASGNGRVFTTMLTEKNIVTLLQAIEGYNFDIQDAVKSYYDTIKSWEISEISAKYNFENLSEGNLFNHLTANIGNLSEADEAIVRDRSVRYQYFVKNQENPEKSLKSLITNRSNANVWINSNEYQLESVIEELINLNRLPLLVVFDSYSAKLSLENLKKLEKSLELLNRENSVGIYFRLDNKEGGEFNKIIADKKYNKNLDNTTEFAGVSAGKLPKFFLQNTWKPMSVISIGTKLKHSKTAVYASACDLIIDYTPTESLMEYKNIWLQ